MGSQEEAEWLARIKEGEGPMTEQHDYRWLAARALELLREYRQNELARDRVAMFGGDNDERKNLVRRRWELQEQIDQLLRQYPEGAIDARCG